MPQSSCSFHTLKSFCKKPDAPPHTASSTESENLKCLVQHKVKAAAETSVTAVCER